jgi:hypothetical protein
MVVVPAGLSTGVLGLVPLQLRHSYTVGFNRLPAICLHAIEGHSIGIVPMHGVPTAHACNETNDGLTANHLSRIEDL